MSQLAEVAIKNRFAAIREAIQAEKIQTETQKESARNAYIESCYQQHPREWPSMANSYRREGVVFLALKVIDWLRNTASSALVKVADGCRIGGAAHSITDKSKTPYNMPWQTKCRISAVRDRRRTTRRGSSHTHWEMISSGNR
ncbi:MAG TPA: hypothetical protein VK638_01490 [Edaphobacter sp.]|nr:hypothetical protein [Edaphobacter sp.]